MDISAWRHDERRVGKREKGLFAEDVCWLAAFVVWTSGRQDDPAGGSAHPDETFAPLGQRARRPPGRRRGGRCRSGVRRGDLLRDARRTVGGGGGRESARDRRCTPAATGAQELHAGTRARFLGSWGHAIFLVPQRQATRALRQHLPGSRRPAADLGILHEQGASPPRSDGASAYLFQGSCSSSEARPAMMMGFFSERGLEIVIAAAGVSVVALIGGLMTDVGPWYESLRFPRLRPPNWLFGPAWTVIFILIAASGVVAWESAENPATRFRLLALFLINGVLNLLWSPLFFKLRRPDWALYELLLFWLSILVLIVALARISSFASLLLTPYLAWVTFAGWLNWRIVQLNKPFGSGATRESSGRVGSDGRVSP